MSLLVLVVFFTSCSIPGFLTIPVSNHNGTDMAAILKYVQQLEVKVSAIQSRSETQEQKQAAVLSSLLSKLTETTHELDILRKNYTTLEANVDKLNEYKENFTFLEKELSSLKTSLNRKQLEHTGINQTDVAFEATSSGRNVAVVSGSVLRFANVLYNAGTCYSKTTGYFTAPVSGTYIFWVSGTFTGQTPLTVNIYKNNKVVGSSDGALIPNVQHRNGYANGITRGITVCGLNEGEKVHFSSASGITLNGEQLTYGGALLHGK